MKSSSAKQKGRLLQHEVRDRLLKKYPELEPEDIRSTGMGQSGADLQLSPAASLRFPYQVECKNLARIAVYKFYSQASSHGNKEPLVVVKQNRSKPLVILDLDYFLGLIK